MASESTKDNVFNASMREKIAEALYEDETDLDKICEVCDSVNAMDDQELFRHAMMHGLLDEDAGQDR